MPDKNRDEPAIEAIARAVYKAWPARISAKTAPENVDPGRIANDLPGVLGGEGQQ